ncbi:MAG: BREX-3 system P-loop-containing protein BrxF [Phycisphaeraceae bacterium]|nr:BREX-3 system P-loop-containing protein BrxF [Phycisphaeraceae bacterium]
MSEPILDKIKQSLQEAEDLYHRLVLLVGEAGSGKTAVLRDLAGNLSTPVINVNLVLSSELLELTAKQRSLRLPGILDQITEKAHPVVVLDNLEILFDKELKQDPLRLLQSISRKRAIVASWNGKLDSGKLIYAEIGHPEYHSYDSDETLIIDMNSTATAVADKNIREAGQA